MISDLQEALFAVCRAVPPVAEVSTVVPEPYAPYVPSNWNGILVVAEAQNLAGDTPYVKALISASTEERIRRLYEDAPAHLRIGPWDDGTLKLAVTAAWPDFTYERFAISNAVPWSQANGTRNLNPEKLLYAPAVAFWRQILATLKPVSIVTVGAVARHILSEARRHLPPTATETPFLRWAPASPIYLNRVSWLFDPEHLCALFPTVARAIEKNPIWVSDHRIAKIFYASHATSIVAARTRAGDPTPATSTTDSG